MHRLDIREFDPVAQNFMKAHLASNWDNFLLKSFSKSKIDLSYLILLNKFEIDVSDAKEEVVLKNKEENIFEFQTALMALIKELSLADFSHDVAEYIEALSVKIAGLQRDLNDVVKESAFALKIKVKIEKHQNSLKILTALLKFLITTEKELSDRRKLPLETHSTPLLGSYSSLFPAEASHSLRDNSGVYGEPTPYSPGIYGEPLSRGVTGFF